MRGYLENYIIPEDDSADVVSILKLGMIGVEVKGLLVTRWMNDSIRMYPDSGVGTI